jgi:hypothetical protein
LTASCWWSNKPIPAQKNKKCINMCWRSAGSNVTPSL